MGSGLMPANWRLCQILKKQALTNFLVSSRGSCQSEGLPKAGLMGVAREVPNPLLVFEKREFLPLPVDQGLTRGDQILLVIEHLDLIVSSSLGPTKLPCLSNESAPQGRGGDVGNIHVQSHCYGSMGVGSGFKRLINQGK